MLTLVPFTPLGKSRAVSVGTGGTMPIQIEIEAILGQVLRQTRAVSGASALDLRGAGPALADTPRK